MDKEKTLAFKEPQRKYNLKLDASSDFRLSSDTGWEAEISGKCLKIVPISYGGYKFFYAPRTVLEVYFLVDDSYLVPVYQKLYVPLGRVKNIVLVRPDGLLSGNVYFQFWLTNIKEIEILDVFEKMNFDVLASGYEIVEIPFPTYEFSLLMLIPSPSDNWGFDIDIYPFATSDHLVLDDVSGLTTTDIVVNTIYKYHFIGGSGAVSNPHYTRPSYRTRIKISNDDAVNPLPSLRLQLLSFED